MKSSKQKNNSDVTYLAVWDQLGLETLIDVTELYGKAVWAELKDEPGPALPNLDMLIMRARFNTHRHYEIYSFCVNSDITAENIKDMFRDNPQAIVNLIREKGNKIYSDRKNPNEVVIT